jgi:hypothetical protein
VSDITNVPITNFRLFHQGAYLTKFEAILPCNIDDGEVSCIFLLKGGIHSGAEIAHPGKQCETCARCNENSTRWYHKVKELAEFLYWLKTQYTLTESDCLCNKCNLEISKSYKNYCLPLKREMTSSDEKPETKRAHIKCEMPKCGHIIKLKGNIRHLNAEYICILETNSDCDLPPNVVKYENVGSSLTTNSPVCEQCFFKVYSYVQTIKQSYKRAIASDSLDLQNIILLQQTKLRNFNSLFVDEICLAKTVL